jgi:hypothetical protein
VLDSSVGAGLCVVWTIECCPSDVYGTSFTQAVVYLGCVLDCYCSAKAAVWSVSYFLYSLTSLGRGVPYTLKLTVLDRARHR